MLILAKNENYTAFKEMKKIIFLSAFICISGLADAQKLYAVVKLTAPFSNLSYAKEYDREEFRPSTCIINGSWGIDLIYNRPKISHKLSLYDIPFGIGFELENKYLYPPYSNGVKNLGLLATTHVTQTNQFALDYSLQKEVKKDKRFLFNSRIRLNYSAGIGVGFNRSENYYRKVLSPYSAVIQNSGPTVDDYYSYSITTTKKGLGLFINGGAGFDFISKKNKRVLSFSVFYKQGLTDIAKYNVHYQYGYRNDPTRQVNVSNQIIYSRGTTYGFSLGVPIKILK